MIKRDQQFQKKISIDEKEKKFEEFSDPGFYIGILLVFIGLFTELGSFSVGLTILGFFTIVFYDDFKKLFLDLKKDFMKRS
ncbi:hypothetical protein SD78_1293 [Bacillus badius]|nr:hypothetical protein SD78_1293 [Bacillus badius]